MLLKDFHGVLISAVFISLSSSSHGRLFQFSVGDNIRARVYFPMHLFDVENDRKLISSPFPVKRASIIAFSCLYHRQAYTSNIAYYKLKFYYAVCTPFLFGNEELALFIKTCRLLQANFGTFVIHFQ